MPVLTTPSMELGSASSESKEDDESINTCPESSIDLDVGSQPVTEDPDLTKPPETQSPEFSTLSTLEYIGKISTLSSLSQKGDRDWAIFPFDHNIEYRTFRGSSVNKVPLDRGNSHGACHVTSFKEHPSTDREIWVVSSSTGAVKAYSSAAPFYLRVRGSRRFTKTRAVYLDRPISK
jgi:hypothetical protein